MTKLTENQSELLQLVREHKQREEELLYLLRNQKVKSINENNLMELISSNYNLEERIRELIYDNDGSPFIDPLVRKQLIDIRNQQTETYNLFLKSIIFDLSTNRKRPEEDIEKRIDDLEKEKREKQDDALFEMTDYISEWARGSITFSERKKEIGSIITERPLPKNIRHYLKSIQHCYLLYNEWAVIGLSRILIEVACRSIYDKLPERDKLKVRNFDGEIGCLQMIRVACDYRLKSRKNKKEIQEIKDKAVSLYTDASNILHGNPSQLKDITTLGFIRDVYFVIESLY